MDLQKFHDEIKHLENSIGARGLEATARGHVNYGGCEISLVLNGCEPWHENGHWSIEREFSNSPDNADAMFEEARAWVAALPGEEDRAIEFMIQKLTRLASELPKGSGELAQVAWGEIHSMLIAKSEQLAKNGLPSPERISKLRA